MIDYRAVVSGFCGSLVGMSFAPRMPAIRQAVTLVSSTGTAGFVLPLAVWYLDLPPRAEPGAAFVIGVSAPYAVPAIFKLFSRPWDLFKRGTEK